jgi:ligand-binding sensor domain-containing protein
VAALSLSVDRRGILWVGTGFAGNGGASRFFDGLWRTWTRSDGLAGGKVRSLFEDRSGRLWFGSEYDGVAVYDGRRWTVFDVRDGLAGHEVKAIVQDDEGVYWLGTDQGLSRIEEYATRSTGRENGE